MGSRVRDQAEPVPGIVVRPSIPADAVNMAPNLRAEDVAECFAAGQHTSLQALQLGYVNSKPCFTVVYEGRPAAMFGVVPSADIYVPQMGNVWLLGTNDINLFSTTFLRESKGWLERLEKDYDLVGNVVDERNQKHVAWLRWLGFHFIARHERFGHLGLPFLEFIKVIAPNV